MRPTPADVAWAAGFAEGEGCFKTHKKRSPCVTVAQKDPESLYRLLALYGGFMSQAKSGVWYWFVYGKRAVRFMEDIYPWMSSRRREKIDEVLLLASTANLWRVEDPYVG